MRTEKNDCHPHSQTGVAPFSAPDELPAEFALTLVEQEMRYAALEEKYAALKASHGELDKQYGSLISVLQEGIAVHDRNGKIVAWNQSTERLLSLTPDQILGRTSLDPKWRCIHEDGTPFPGDTHPSSIAFKTGKLQTNVIMGVHKADGTLTWICVNAVPVLGDDDATPLRVIVSFSDITETKRVSDQLRLSDSAVRAVSQGVIITGADEKIISVNEAFSAITGYTSAEVIGLNCRFLQGALTARHTVKAMREALKNKTGFNGEILNYRKNGSAFWNDMAISPVFDAQGNLTHFVGITRDITERKSATEKILQLSLALEQSPEMVVITNIDAEIEYVNTAFVQSTGYSRENVIGRNPRFLQSGHTLPQSYLDMWATLIAGKAWSGNLHNCRKDGTEYIESAIITPLRQSDGKISHYVAVKHDITEQLRAEEEMNLHRFHLEEMVARRTIELTLAREQAEVANNAKSRFLAATSHDLRQPLSALNLYVGVLKKSIDKDNAKLVSHIQDCVDSLSDLLTNLLDMSKLDAHVVMPEMSDFSVDELFSTLISIHSGEAQLKGLHLRVRSSGLFAHTDQGLLQRIVGNLLSNAIEHTQKGGVLISCRRHQGRYWIEVWDTGIGIAEDKFGIIFEEFRQLADDARTRGSGLGLSIVAKASKLLGLEIRLRSRLGHGSMFAVELPLGRAAQISALPKIPLAVRSLRIALVDDNVAVLHALTMTLKSVGHEVIGAANNAMLLAALKDHAPDLIISDYRLAAGETGFDVIAAVRERFGFDLPAFIITGDTDPALVRSMATHDIAVQYKPLKLELLQTYINQATERRGRR